MPPDVPCFRERAAPVNEAGATLLYGTLYSPDSWQRGCWCSFHLSGTIYFCVPSRMHPLSISQAGYLMIENQASLFPQPGIPHTLHHSAMALADSSYTASEPQEQTAEKGRVGHQSSQQPGRTLTDSSSSRTHTVLIGLTQRLWTAVAWLIWSACLQHHQKQKAEP